MESTIAGKAFKFGDNINSDIIIPGRYLIYIEPEKLAQHAFEVLGEGFPQKLRQFAIIVAGRNFGCGSAREQAVTAIQGLGVKAVIACSFARTFYRNAINSGLPIIECPDLFDSVKEGDELRIDLQTAQIHHQQNTYDFPKFPDSVRRLLELGGLAEYLKAQQKSSRP
jgi:3-isopropylmalate/(R)-2-methylmalate dehydratase small subunit